MRYAADKQLSIAFLRPPPIQTGARCATTSTMPADYCAGDPCFELKCSAYELKGAMLGFGAEGSIYKLNCRYLTASEREGLEKAAESKTQVCLKFSEGSIVLANVKVQRLEDGWTGIEGRLVRTRTSGRN